MESTFFAAIQRAMAASSAVPMTPNVPGSSSSEVIDGGSSLPENTTTGSAVGVETTRQIFVVLAALVLITVLVWLLFRGNWRACFVRCRRSRLVQTLSGVGRQEASLDELVVSVVKHQDASVDPPQQLSSSSLEELPTALPFGTNPQASLEGPEAPLPLEEVVTSDGEDWNSAASNTSL